MRLAFIDYFPTHYRTRLYEEIGRRCDADFYFYADARERYWNRRIPLAADGDYRRVELRRYRPFGQAVMPGLALRLRKGRYDAVVKSLNGKLMLPLVYGTAKTAGLPFVLWTGMWHHPETTVHRYTRRLSEGIYRGADAIVAYGDHVRRFVLETPGVDPDKVFVAGQAVRPDRFEAQPASPAGSSTVLFIGQFEERKGVDDLLAAFRAVDAPGARLELIGNGALEPRVRELAAADPRVDIVGYVSQEDLPGRLAAARCLVLPSVTTAEDREPWGLVVNEAMHAGLPVIASDGVGAAAGGLVRDAHNGFVVAERDRDGLALAISSLLDDPQRAALMGERGRGDVAAFNYDRMADAFVSAAEFATRRRRRSA